MTVSPVGLLALTKHRLRDLLIASPTWQTMCGGSSAASDRAFINEAPPRSPTPHAIITHGDGYTQTRDGIRDGVMIQSGDLVLYFCANALPGAGNTDAFTEFDNRIQAIINDIFKSGNGGHGIVLDSWMFAKDGSPMRVVADQRDKFGDLIFCEMIIAYRMWD